MYRDAKLWESQIPKRYAFYHETQKTVRNENFWHVTVALKLILLTCKTFLVK